MLRAQRLQKSSASSAGRSAGACEVQGRFCPPVSGGGGRQRFRCLGRNGCAGAPHPTQAGV
eukprot:1980442-Lingulodinium_polyedra.AAC.1